MPLSCVPRDKPSSFVASVPTHMVQKASEGNLSILGIPQLAGLDCTQIELDSLDGYSVAQYCAAWSAHKHPALVEVSVQQYIYFFQKGMTTRQARWLSKHVRVRADSGNAQRPQKRWLPMYVADMHTDPCYARALDELLPFVHGIQFVWSDDRDVPFYPDALQSVLVRCRNLTHVELVDLRSGDARLSAGKQVLAMCRTMAKVTHLGLGRFLAKTAYEEDSDYTAYNEAIALAVSATQGLTSLDISHSQDDAGWFLMFVRAEIWEQLRVLDVSHMHFNLNPRTFLRHCASLQALSFRGSSLAVNATTLGLIQSLNSLKCLQVLDLSEIVGISTQAKDAGDVTLADILGGTFEALCLPEVTVLKLNAHHEHGALHDVQFAFETLGKLLEGCPKLATLHLEGVCIAQRQRKYIQSMLSTRPDHPLRVIWFGNGDDCIRCTKPTRSRNASFAAPAQNHSSQQRIPAATIYPMNLGRRFSLASDGDLPRRYCVREPEPILRAKPGIAKPMVMLAYDAASTGKSV